ncbi:hypothetical protein M426DRAFT_14515 [Hypoxylon sp. CI-4A]|nr:hypothetical protein M426DRAFT_14515 [Hypoxylon sp. CI-4A]
MTTLSPLPAAQQFPRRQSSSNTLPPNSSRNLRGSRHSGISKHRANRISRSRKPYPAWGVYDEDSRRLAADPNVVLPSDRSLGKPKFERQEAFHEPNAQWYYSDIVEDDSDLYKLGLLYDDDYTRGSCFSLDTIVHSEPVYSVRPTKRRRNQPQDKSYLHLDLSFTSPGQDEIAYADIHVSSPQDSHNDDKSSARSAALSTIHELPESSLEAPAPEAIDFPDLVSDIDEEDESAQDWALLDKTDVLSTFDDDADIREEDAIVDVLSATGEAWVVLGDGS